MDYGEFGRPWTWGGGQWESHVSLGCPRMSQLRGMVSWENIKTMEPNPWAPISQMAKLRLRGTGDLPTSGWWRGRLSLSPLLVEPLWAGWRRVGSEPGSPGKGWRRWPRKSSEQPLAEPREAGWGRGG